MGRSSQVVRFAQSSNDHSRAVLCASLIQAFLWLAASVVSALLVYWLYLTPTYGWDWTASYGGVVFAAVSLYGAASCLARLVGALTDIRNARNSTTRRT
jgi:hypothetical protein